MSYIHTRYNLRGHHRLHGIERKDGLMAKIWPAAKLEGIRCSIERKWSGDRSIGGVIEMLNAQGRYVRVQLRVSVRIDG